MNDLILHHYPASPFAEKIRAILGYKGLAWGSVVIPVIMPKPDLTALTGGYRKTPVLQLGCDVYCDTYRIAQLLDELHPARPVFWPEQAGVAVPAGRFFDSALFFAAIALLLQPSAAAALFSQMPATEAGGFAKDRADLMRGARLAFPALGEARGILADALGRLDAQLAQSDDNRGLRGDDTRGLRGDDTRGLRGAPFLFGAEPGWADFCAYHPLHALRGSAALAGELAPYGHVLRWMDRIAAFGHGAPRELSGADALAIARQAKPRPLPASSGPPLDGVEPGDTVEVAASDYGSDPVRGTLVHVDAREVAVEREDERAGAVVVHFPRVGFAVTACVAGG